VALVWHARSDADPALGWFRSLLLELLDAIRADVPG